MEVQNKAKHHETKSTWQEVKILATARSRGKELSGKLGGKVRVIRNTQGIPILSHSRAFVAKLSTESSCMLIYSLSIYGDVVPNITLLNCTTTLASIIIVILEMRELNFNEIHR